MFFLAFIVFVVLYIFYVIHTTRNKIIELLEKNKGEEALQLLKLTSSSTIIINFLFIMINYKIFIIYSGLQFTWKI